MAFPLILTKFKSLLPVLVVGGAVAITIKLLTQQNTPTSQLLSVEAEEDIAKVDEHVEELEPETQPPAPPEPEEEVADAEEEEVGDEEEQDSEEDGSGGAESEPKEDEEKSQEQEKDEKQPEARSIKPSAISDILTELLND